MSESSNLSIILQFPRNYAQNVNRRLILKLIKEQKESLLASVEYVSQQINNRSWVVTFDSKEAYDQIVGRKIQFGDFQVEAQDLSSFNRFSFITYKVLWLPHRFPKEKLSQFFSRDGIEVIEIQEELYVDEEFPELKIKSGNFLVKIKIDKSKNVQLLPTNVYNFDKIKFLVSRFGEKPKCLRCSEYGHIRKNCPLNSLRCSQCGKNGHSVRNCNMATRTAIVDDPELPDESDDNIFDSHDGDEKTKHQSETIVDHTDRLPSTKRTNSELSYSENSNSQDTRTSKINKEVNNEVDDSVMEDGEIDVEEVRKKYEQEQLQKQKEKEEQRRRSNQIGTKYQAPIQPPPTNPRGRNSSTSTTNASNTNVSKPKSKN